MNDDLISRKQVISFLKDLAYDKDMGHEGVTAVCMACGGIDRMPAVDAEPVKHSEWVEEKDRVLHWHCRECGLVEGIAHYMMHYCPNCGAKMDKEKKT